MKTKSAWNISHYRRACSGAIKVQFLVELANRDVSGFVGKIFSVEAYFYNRVFTE